MPASRRPLLLAAAATALIAAARLSPAPSLFDAATGLPAAGVRLAPPLWHLLLTPWAGLADVAVCSSRSQAFSFLLLLFALGGPARWALGQGRRQWLAPAASSLALGAYALACLVFLAWVLLVPRVPARLIVDDPDELAVDFHSHTNASWDGRRSFDPAANLRWHEGAGYGAAFITDHNRMEGARQARRLSVTSWQAGRPGTAGLEGEEVSLHGAHVLLLGPRRAADPAQYEGLDGLRRFLGDAGAVFGGLAVMSAPEYYEHHAGRLETLADWGAAGFEIVSSSPKGLGVPASFRRETVELCRRRNLFVVAGSDNHGYGATACVWNLVRVPGWPALSPEERERAVMKALRERGFAAVRVVARGRCLATPGSVTQALFDAPRAVWDLLRSWTAAQAAAALAWAWGLAALAGLLLEKKVT